MLSLIEAPPWLSVGEIDETVGAIVSAVVNPVGLSYWLLKALPAVSFAAVVTLIK